MFVIYRSDPVPYEFQFFGKIQEHFDLLRIRLNVVVFLIISTLIYQNIIKDIFTHVINRLC